MRAHKNFDKERFGDFGCGVMDLVCVCVCVWKLIWIWSARDQFGGGE